MTASGAGRAIACPADGETIRFDASLSLKELYAELGERELLVEPLSATRPIAAFLAEGGLGYGGAREGTFAATVCRVKTGGFEYGSDHQALYNVGYPLHRMAEGGPMGRAEACLGDRRALELTVYVQPRRRRAAFFCPCDADSAIAPGDASDVFYVNAAAARLFGLERAGLVSIFTADSFPERPPADGGRVDGLWEKRFIEDALPPGQAALKALTQPSRLAPCARLMDEIGGAFFGLFVRLGILALAAAPENQLGPAAAEILSAPLTWRLPSPRSWRGWKPGESRSAPKA